MISTPGAAPRSAPAQPCPFGGCNTSLIFLLALLLSLLSVYHVYGFREEEGLTDKENATLVWSAVAVAALGDERVLSFVEEYMLSVRSAAAVMDVYRQSYSRS